MKSKQQSNDEIRVLGQRSIPFSLFSRSYSNLGLSSKDDLQTKGISKDSSISLSDFLDQKLHANPVQSKIVKGKSRPFKSPLGPRDDNDGSVDHLIGIRKEEKGKNSVIDQVVFEQFKPISTEKKDDIGSSNGGGSGESGTSGTSLVGLDSFPVGEIGASNSNNVQVTARKRRNPFEDVDGKHATRKQLLVLGDDTEPRQKARRKSFLDNRRHPGPSFNHYGNGSGWWDSDMEGVDTEEVGLGDVWEGVGSTTFGVIDWH